MGVGVVVVQLGRPIERLERAVELADVLQCGTEVSVVFRIVRGRLHCVPIGLDCLVDAMKMLEPEAQVAP